VLRAGVLRVSDARATELLWERFASDLAAWFRGRGVGADAAEDLLQETFLRLHDRRESLADEDRVAGWVRRVARNVWIDHLRRSGAHPTEEAAEPQAEGQPDEVEAAVAGWLRGFVAALPEPYREAVELSELEGLSQAEVAERQGLSLSGAKSRVQRGRAKLREALLACCAFEFDRRGGLVGWSRRRDGSCAGDCRR